MTPVKTKQTAFILGRLSGLPTIHAFRRQTTREKRVFVFFLLPLQLVGLRFRLLHLKRPHSQQRVHRYAFSFAYVSKQR